ncbi:MAG: hypothetical protein LQ345_003173 [Seirophora villosa]|nr:MAG: hypothetical protein LQ345_003173 [Seirophora villosa]
MGSRDPETDTAKDEVTVLVTGFGVRSPPFGNNAVNPSHLIASTLPISFTGENLPNIKILHASPIPVQYRVVRNVVPRIDFPPTVTKGGMEPFPPLDTLTPPRADDDDLPHVDLTLETRPGFDFILHIGMAGPRKYYTMETCAHRDGYVARDQAGESFEHDTYWRDTYKSPEVLRSGFDVEDVWRRWKSDLMGVDVRPSNDAGRYLCDFTYYTSLVEYWRRDPGGKAPAMFLHVPGKIEDLDIETGRKVALGLIGAMVGSSRRKEKEEEEEGA